MKSNHPHRSKILAKSISPDPAEIIALRKKCEITQTTAGALVHSTCRAWQKWEAGDCRMHPAMWELFQIKTGLPPAQE